MTRARKSALELALEDYDGRHADVLKELVEGLEPRPDVLRQAVRLAVHDDERIAKGATYLLWSWVSAGARMTPVVVRELAELLPRVTGKWSRLHVARCVPAFDVPEELVGAFAAFLETCRRAELPFLRAWAIDALHELSMRHPSLADPARAAMEDGANDPAPSVRKRVEKIVTGR